MRILCGDRLTPYPDTRASIGKGEATAVTSPLSLTDLTGKQRYSPRSDCRASHQGKTESRSSTSSTSGLGLSLSLGRRSPPRPTLGLGLSLGLGRRSPPRPTLGLGLGRSHILARPRPRPQEKSPPRPTSASDRLRYRGCIITLLLASCLRLRRNKTGVSSKVTPAAGNDGSPCAPMTPVALKPPTKARQRQQDSCRADSCASTGLKALLRRPR
jgi:hypothetical protein